MASRRVAEWHVRVRFGFMGTVEESGWSEAWLRVGSGAGLPPGMAAVAMGFP
jgi:hypothetical protein